MPKITQQVRGEIKGEKRELIGKLTAEEAKAM